MERPDVSRSLRHRGIEALTSGRAASSIHRADVIGVQIEKERHTIRDQTVTFLNVLDVEPDRQQELVDLLTGGAEMVFRHRPGFISLTLLASRDGRRVINLARWTTAEAVSATQSDPEAADYATRTAAIATPGPGLYDVVAEIG